MKRVIALLCAGALLGLSACGSPAAAADQDAAALLVGEWEGSEGLLEFQALAFVPEGDDISCGEVVLGLLSGLIGGRYEVIPTARSGAPDRLCITYTLSSLSVRRNYSFCVDEETLTLTNDSTGAVLLYRRCG